MKTQLIRFIRSRSLQVMDRWLHSTKFIIHFLDRLILSAFTKKITISNTTRTTLLVIVYCRQLVVTNTLDHCLHECIVDKLIHECDCVPGYLESRPLNRTQMTINKKVWMDATNYTGESGDVPDYPIFENGVKGRNDSFDARGSAAKSCSLYAHATCVSVIIRNFNYTSCKSCNGMWSFQID